VSNGPEDNPESSANRLLAESLSNVVMLGSTPDPEAKSLEPTEEFISLYRSVQGFGGLNDMAAHQQAFEFLLLADRMADVLTAKDEPESGDQTS
jgi:hypothetical protein